MPFTSFRFLFFLAAVVFVYYIVPKKFQWAVLLVSSYAFYLYSGIENVFFIIGTTLFTYFSALLMQKMRDKNQKNIDALGKNITLEQKREMKKAVAKKIHTVQEGPYGFILFRNRQYGIHCERARQASRRRMH